MLHIGSKKKSDFGQRKENSAGAQGGFEPVGRPEVQASGCMKAGRNAGCASKIIGP